MLWMLLAVGTHAAEIRGIVVDQYGRPVPHAKTFVDPRSSCCIVDASGRFEFTADDLVIFRKPGYQSAVVQLQDSVSELRVVLRKLNEAETIRSCEAEGTPSVGLDGWSAYFRFRDRAGMKLSQQSKDVDSGARQYSIGSQSILHGSGPMWSFGLPELDPLMKNYEERIWSVNGIEIIEARGEKADGNRSRFLGRFGETVEYRDVDPVTAKIFDKFMDSVCIGVHDRTQSPFSNLLEGNPN